MSKKQSNYPLTFKNTKRLDEKEENKADLSVP